MGCALSFRRSEERATLYGRRYLRSREPSGGSRHSVPGAASSASVTVAENIRVDSQQEVEVEAPGTDLD